MRRVPYVYGLAVLSVVLLLCVPVSARPREERPVREPRRGRAGNISTSVPINATPSTRPLSGKDLVTLPAT